MPDLVVREAPMVASAGVLAWDFAWRVPPDQGGYVVTCRHRHYRPAAASVCTDREFVASNGLGWQPLGIMPSPDQEG